MTSRANKKKWKRIIDNSMRGAYGETDMTNKVIRINKARHKKKVPRIVKKKDGTEHLGNTLLHEELHAKHWNTKEKNIKKKALALWKKLKPREKKKLYSRYA